MTVRRHVVSLLLFAALLGLPAGRARAAGLDPFRKAGSPRAATLDPFRVAQAEPAPAATQPDAAPAAKQAQPAPKQPAAAATQRACRTDEDCPAENICSNASCQAIQVSTNILYLYYREGSFREVLGLYWSRRGATGYTVLVPVWWHFWSPQTQSRVVAPFFWRFEDYVKQSVLTVIVPGLPISWSHQPGATSFGVWPLFYKSTRFGWAAPLLGTFHVKDPDRGTSFGAAAYLYWWKRTPERSFDVLFPLFASSRSADRSFTWALPLNFYWRRADHEHILAFPLFYGTSHKNGGSFYTVLGYDRQERTRRSGSLLWLYWFSDDPKERSGYDVLFPIVWDYRGPNSRSSVAFPLFWHFRENDAHTTVFFPLVWSFGSKDGSSTVAGPWVHLRRGNWTFDTVFPVWWSSHDGDSGSAFRSLLPLFFWKSEAHGRRVALYSPLGGYARDDDERSKGWLFLPFLSLQRRNPERLLRVLTPLYIHHESEPAQSSTTLIGLALLYLRKDAQGSTSMFTPLIWHFRDAPSGATATAVLPFFAHRAGPRDTSTYAGVLPLWFYWRRFVGGGWGAGLFPLAFFGNNERRTHAVVFPLLWHFGNPQGSTTVAAPLFYWRNDPHGHARAILPLLTFWGERDGDSYVASPLLWRFASASGGWSTTVTPLGYGHRDRDGWSAGVGPLVPLLYYRSGQQRSHAVLFPLFWHFRDAAEQRSTTVVGPYWHRTVGAETTDALFPLLHYRRGARPGGADETSFTFFPFVHYRHDRDTRLLVTPLGASAQGPRRAAGFLGPYFWYRDRDLSVGLIPFLHADVTRQATGERTRQFGPWFQIDAPGRKSRVLFPLWGHYADAAESDTYVFPSYFRQRRTDGYAVDSFLPLFWRSSWPGHSTTVVGPYYDRVAPGVHNTGFVPLWFHARNPHRTVTVVPPLLFVRHVDHDQDRERLWCALLWHRRDRDESRTVVFPFWWSGAGGGRTRQVLFPLYWHFTDAAQRTAQTVVGPLYWSSWGTGVTRGFLTAWYSRDPAQGSGSNAFVPLFYHGYGRDRFTLLTLLAGYRRNGPARAWYLWPAYFSDSVTNRFGMVAPFWFSKTNKVMETNTTVIPPLLSYAHSTPEESFATALLLFWRYRDVSSSTTLGLPLYYDQHDFNLSRTTVLLPLLLRHHRASDQSTTWVAPLFYRHSTPTDTTMVGFPLLWHFRHGESHTTLFFPLYANWRRPGYESTYVFPTIYHRVGLTAAGAPDGTYRYVVAPLYSAAVKRPGDFMWEVLGGLVGHERIGRNRYLKLFFMSFEQEPAPRAQTSWYSQPARPSRKASPRGLSMNSW